MTSADTQVPTDHSNTTETDFQQMLARCTQALTACRDEKSLAQVFCSAGPEYVGVELQCWLRATDGSYCRITAEDNGSRGGSSVPQTVLKAVREQRVVSEFVHDGSTTGHALTAAPIVISAQALGVFVAEIAQEQISKLSAISSLAGAYLEMLQSSRAAERDRHRAEELVTLAQELNSPTRMSQLVSSLTSRVTTMLGASAAVLAIAHRNQLTVTKSSDATLDQDRMLMRNLNAALANLLFRRAEPIIFGVANELFGCELAAALAWRNAAVARLQTNGGELLAVLIVGNCADDFGAAEGNLLEAVCGHAAVALENSRLFGRMDAANRHWIEIFDSISDFIVVHDEQCNVLRVNRSLADFIGVKPSEMIGVGMNALLAMGEETATGCPFCHLLGDSDEYVHSGLDRTYLISTSRIHGAASEALQTIHVLKDITDRREAERRYRELFDNIQEGLYFSSPDGRFIEVNNALVRMLGYESREELLQVDIARQLFLSPEQRTRLEEAVSRNRILRNFEITMRRKDGSLIHTLQNAFVVRDAAGKAVQYRGLILDITELKQFQAELQRERDFSSKILNNTQSMILVVDTAGLISYANRRCFAAGGYKPEAVLGTRLRDLIAPNKHPQINDALDSTLEGNQVDNLELPVVLGSGRVAQFSVNLSPMRDELGAVNSIVVVMTDITDAAMLQAKLMHTEKMAAVGQLVSGVAHEVNNPLTAVLGFTDLLLENAEVPDDAKSDLMIIMQEAQRTKQIVQNLLSFARQTPAKRGMVQVNNILDRTVALRAYDFANHDVQIVQELDLELPEILADGHQLQQVFLNILNNAYDAVRETGRAGEIRIRTQALADGVEITLSDNGPGIKSPDRIFDPFFTTKEVGKGTGLGLSICYGIVKEHEGEIACHNNEAGPGATFVVRLPIGTEKACAASAGGAL
jgi:two-component system NtrC family sensor kinase